MKKLVVTSTHSMLGDKSDKLKTMLAELYGVCEEDVVFLPEGVTATVIEGAAKKTPKEEEKPDDLDALTVEELREMARTQEINLHGASTKDEIVKAIKKAK